MATQSARTLDEVRVQEAMHAGVVSCPLEVPLSEVAHLLAEHGVHCVVGYGDVTEDDTQVWGVISDLDLVSAAASGEISDLPASAAAATEVLQVAPESPLDDAARLMSEHEVTHLLVVESGSDRPVGVLSTLDIARVLAGRGPR